MTLKTIDPKLGPLTVGVFVENEFEPMHFPIELDVRDEKGFVPDGPRPTIAKVCYGATPEEMLATAKFFAAAPDLLAALENVAAWIGCNVFSAEVNHLQELRNIHKVIARAHGEK